MNIEKIRNLTDSELTHQQRELADQLFKLKFQLNMGQSESLKKMREMRKDIARINTVAREKQIAGGNGSVKAAPVAAKVKPAKTKAAKTKTKTTKPAAAKKAAKKKKKTAATEKK